MLTCPMNSKKTPLVKAAAQRLRIHSALMLLSWLVLAIPVFAQQPPSLFVDTPLGESSAARVDVVPGDPVEVLRSRPISLSRETWRSTLGQSATKRSSLQREAAASATFTLNLFGDTSFAFYLESLTATSDGIGQTVQGRIGDHGEGTAILTYYQGALSGSIRLASGEFYEVFVAGSGIGEVRQVRFRGLGAQGTDAIVPENEGAGGEDRPEPARERKPSASAMEAAIHTAGGAPVVDVLVAYTGRARQARGGAAGMLAHINQVIAESNTALVSSAVNMQFRLAHTVEVSADDSASNMNYSNVLGALRSPADGELDELHALREQYSADMVSLWVSPPLPGSETYTIGMAYILGGSPETFGENAFSVVHQTYAGGSSATFAHEAGHNLGLNHDPDNGGVNGGLFPDSVGYQQKALNPKFFTIMAYSAKCGDCQRLTQFSNPELKFQATAIPTGVTGKNDAARTLNIVAPSAARWRGSAAPLPACVYSVSPASLNAPAAGGHYELNVSSSIGCSWAPVSHASWIVLNGNGTRSGSGTFSLSVANNLVTDSRSSIVEVAGRTISISQAAAVAQPKSELRISAKGLSLQAESDDPPSFQVLRLRSALKLSSLNVSALSAPWLSASATLVDDTWQINVRASAQGLREGTYNATLQFDCGTAVCDPGSIPVRLVVRNPSATGPRIGSGGVVNAASFQPGISSGAWISVFGTNLASTSRTWQTSDFQGSQMPLSLDGVQILVDGRLAAVHFVSPEQVNFQAPSNLAIGWVQVELRTPAGSDFAYVYSSREAPGFFMFDSEGHVAALHPDGTPVGDSNGGTSYAGLPASPGTVLAIYGTGFGPTSPDVPSGEVFPGVAPLVSASSVVVTIGGKPAEIPFAGLTGAGLNQINAVVPALAPGTYEIVADVAGSPTQFSGKLMVQ